MPAPIATLDDARRLLFAGDCTFTVVSQKSGERRTFRIAAAKPDARYPTRGPAWFASVLTGPDNGSDYTYVGMLTAGTAGIVPGLRLTAKSTMRDDSPPVAGLRWLLDVLRRDHTALWARAEVWHADTCARCGRALTDPASIARRLGPTCAGYSE